MSVKTKIPLPKVTPTIFSGVYDCGDYQIKLADKSGGKAGKNGNRTSTLQVTNSDGINAGYMIEYQARFTICDRESYDKAEKKCVLWIAKHPKEKI